MIEQVNTRQAGLRWMDSTQKVLMSKRAPRSSMEINYNIIGYWIAFNTLIIK